MAARYPSRDEYRGSFLPRELQPAQAVKPAEAALSRPVRRKPQKLSRRKRATAVYEPGNLDVRGLAGDRAFQALKRICKARAGNRCERCGSFGKLHVHHRKLLSQGGPDHISNLASLCVFCHAWCHAHVSEAVRAGFIVPSWNDPAERPMHVVGRGSCLLTSDADYAPVEGA